MLEQVNIIYSEIMHKITVMMGRYSVFNTVLTKRILSNSPAQREIEENFQFKSIKNAEKLAILSFKVNNSQQIEQFSHLIIKLKGVYRVYIRRESIERLNIRQKNGRFSYLNVARELVG